MQTQVNIKCSQSWKDDVEKHADKRGQSVSEYLREAARQQMQRDIANEERD